MDSFLLVAGALYFLAIALCGMSLALPLWVVSNVQRSDLNLGLLVHCQQIYGRSWECQYADGPLEWILAAVLIILGIIALAVGNLMIMFSDKRPRFRRYPKYMGLTAWTLFCLAIMMFPAGFDLPLIGGDPYLLPNSVKTGISYGLFFTGIICTFFGSALALGKMYFDIIVLR
ncbi:modulator of smoothened protein-like [Asterias amurensis]|uniref:modulator of smoothened protein-like n=1 Tax=Asterias amurensis TaxID=7602 RepID=UPI003AB3E093